MRVNMKFWAAIIKYIAICEL